MRKGWIVFVSAAAVVVMSAAAAWMMLGGSDRVPPGYSDDGPVIQPHKNGYLVRYGVGDVFTDGYQRVLLKGTEPGVLERVELVGPDVDHFKLLGVLVAGTERRIGSVQVYEGFSDHPTDREAKKLGQLVPAEGAELPPGKLGSALQIGLEVVKPGLAIRTGVRIYYSVGGEQYVAHQPGGIVNCPKGTSLEVCFDELYAVW